MGKKLADNFRSEVFPSFSQNEVGDGKAHGFEEEKATRNGLSVPVQLFVTRRLDIKKGVGK
jgi:hypothetical protein